MTSFNFSGWNFTEWLKGNWPTIKELLKVGVPFVTIWLTTGNWWTIGFGTILGKFILDSVHYFVKE